MAVYTTASARKHGLTDEEVEYAWKNVFEYRRVRQDKQPPHYMSIGTLPDGRTAEMVAYSTGLDWVVFHCMTPVTPGFLKEFRGTK